MSDLGRGDEAWFHCFLIGKHATSEPILQVETLFLSTGFRHGVSRRILASAEAGDVLGFFNGQRYRTLRRKQHFNVDSEMSVDFLCESLLLNMESFSPRLPLALFYGVDPPLLALFARFYVNSSVCHTPCRYVF